MRFSEDVKPVDELVSSGAQLVRSVAEERRTILLTDNGAAKAVLMDVASYDQWRNTVAMLKLIAQSEADVEAGRTVSQDDAFARATVSGSDVFHNDDEERLSEACIHRTPDRVMTHHK